MVNDETMRASDADREQVVDVLRMAYTEGRLTLDEFDERTSAAYSSKTWGDLRSLTSDLPSGADLSGPRPAGDQAPRQIQDMPVGAPPSRPMIVPLLPVAILFLIVAMSAHAVVLFIPALIILMIWRGTRHRHGTGRRPRGEYSPPPGRPFPPSADGG